jgi:tetratricopeptide (TPR) repeat protein/tRNA A-37 threonylcarbamoyl transferase component Bud32
MTQSWICSQGHCWESNVSPVDTGQAVRCSLCGELGEPNPGATRPNDPDHSNHPTVAHLAKSASQREVPSIPGFEFLGRLGEGGMGAVFKARHVRLGRIVALKVIRDASLSPRLRVRFQIEAESLASLSHPNIVQIFEVGEHDDQPYIALEFVDGGTLRQRLAVRRLTPNEAAQLLATLGRAMHAAHERGIIHRDLKPDNILLAADGSPKISDFGVAKRLLEDKAKTVTGIAIGTPAYMAPEQAAGDQNVTPLADVFALGVMLYELLTGRVPFDAETTASMLHRLRTDDPAPLSTFDGKAPRDLEVICFKCLEKNPARRYASAAAFAADLERFLRHEPIEARPASAYERAAKWARRNPTTAALGAAAAVFLVVSTFLGIWSYREVSAARHQAGHHLKLARDMLDHMYAKVTENWLEDGVHKDPLHQEFLEKTSRFYQEIARDEGRDRALRRAQAQAYFRVGEIYHKLGQGADAQTPFDRAIDLQRQLAREDAGDLAVLEDLAKSYAKRGQWRWETKHPAAEAAKDFHEAKRVYERLADKSPDPAEYIGRLGNIQYNLGLVAQDSGQLDLAKHEFDQAVAFLEPLAAKHPENVAFRQDLARSHINRGVFYRSKGPELFRQAEREYDRAIELLDPKDGPALKPPLAVDLVDARQNLGNLHYLKGETRAAETVLEEARVELEKLTGEFPNRLPYQNKLANTYNSLGSVYVQANNFARAAEKWETARARLGTLLKAQPAALAYRQELGLVLGNLGWLETEKKDWTKARDLVEQAIDHLQAAAAPNPNDALLKQEISIRYRTLAEICLNLVPPEPAAAAAAAQKMAEAMGSQPQDWYYAACFQARAAALIQNADDAEPIVRQCLHSLSTALQTPGGRLIRLANENDVFTPLARHPEGQKWLKALRDVPK